MFGCYNFFRWESTLETKCEILWDQHAYSTCSGLKTLYVCTFYNPDEGDTISVETLRDHSSELVTTPHQIIWIA